MSDNSKKFSKFRDDFLRSVLNNQKEVFVGRFPFKVFAKPVSLGDLPVTEDAVEGDSPLVKQQKSHRRNAYVAAKMLVDEEGALMFDCDSTEDIEFIVNRLSVGDLTQLTEAVNAAPK